MLRRIARSRRGGGGGASFASRAVAAAITTAAVTGTAAMTVPYSDDPADILGATPDLWLDAYQGVLEADASAAEDGEEVATWENQGGADWADAAQGTASKRPLYRATGWTGSRPCIEWVATDADVLTATIANATADDSWVIWGVHLPDLTNSRALIEATENAGTANQGFSIFYTSDSVATGRWADGVGTSDSTGDPIDAGTARVTCLQGITASRSLFENNTLLTGGTNPNVVSRSIRDINQYYIGTLANSTTFPYDGKIAEIIVFKGTVDATQLAAMQARFAEKWGIV